MPHSKYIHRAVSLLSDEDEAAAELASQLGPGPRAGLLFFCSSDYDLDRLGAALERCFDCPVVGCTTAGEIGPKYSDGSIVAASLSAEKFRIHPRLIKTLGKLDAAASKAVADELRCRLQWSSRFDGTQMFGLLLIDGMSVLEEQVVAFLHAAIHGVQLIGGSAGDNMRFEKTHVYYGGKFHSDAAVFTLVESRLPFHAFKLQHFEPSEMDLVVTEADPEQRIVYEINGGPAAAEYAETVGLSSAELSPQIFSKYPVMLQIGDEWYVRSIQKVNEDGSLTFFCAIDNGLPLTVARGVGFLRSLRAQVQVIQSRFSSIECTIGCDCIHRRLELTAAGHTEQVEAELSKLNFLGFSTFGEQFGGLHVNQTLTAVVLGGE